MGFLTHDQKARIIRLRSNGKGASEIVRILAEDDIKISHWSIIRFLKRYQERQSLENAPKSGRPSQGVTTELMNFIDTEMERNDELTSPELARRILLHFGIKFFTGKSQATSTEAWLGSNRHQILPAYSRAQQSQTVGV